MVERKMTPPTQYYCPTLEELTHRYAFSKLKYKGLSSKSHDINQSSLAYIHILFGEISNPERFARLCFPVVIDNADCTNNQLAELISSAVNAGLSVGTHPDQIRPDSLFTTQILRNFINRLTENVDQGNSLELGGDSFTTGVVNFCSPNISAARKVLSVLYNTIDLCQCQVFSGKQYLPFCDLHPLDLVLCGESNDVSSTYLLEGVLLEFLGDQCNDVLLCESSQYPKWNLKFQEVLLTKYNP